jgi:hypothetical protein
MFRTIAAFLLSLFAVVSAAHGQAGTITPPAPPQRPGMPPSGTTPAGPPPPGTAILRGHVTAADTGQPLRKAQVRIFAPPTENRMVTTDVDGAYEFKEVRAGRYTITASKGSYVGLTYGQERPLEAGKPLEILEHQTVERLDFALPRGSVITGRIVDEFGEPMPEVQVAPMRYQFMQGRRQLMPTGRFGQTNDLGEFRIFGLPPGQYYVSATWRSQNFGPLNNADRTAYAPLYFPGTVDVAQAKRITVDVGQQIDGMVMALVPVKATKITGTATDSQGKPMTGFLQVMQSNGSFGGFVQGAQIRPDGTFTINGIPPGEYTLRAQPNGPMGPDVEYATAKVTATGDDITDFRLAATKPSTASGRVIFEPGATPPASLSLGVFPLEPGPMMGPMFPAKVGDDMTFELRSQPGLMRINVQGMGMTGGGAIWRIRAVRLNGIDITDSGLEFKPNEDIKGLEVELTSRTTTLSGLVTNARGEASKNYTAIVFSQDRERWIPNSRYQSIGRPDQDGRFKISGLPAGNYYIIAVDNIDPSQATDPELLDRIRTRAQTFSLSDGETKSIDLRVMSVS